MQGRHRAEHFVDAVSDRVGELSFAFLAQEFAIVGSHGFEVRLIVRAERLEGRQCLLEVAARP